VSRGISRFETAYSPKCLEGAIAEVAPGFGRKHHALRWKGLEAARDQAGGEGEVTMPYSYNCREYPGMEECPGSFVAASEEEVFKHVELHASEAHGEDPAQWSEEEAQMVKDLIRSTA
jgi:predicted small metal-binding protein